MNELKIAVLLMLDLGFVGALVSNPSTSIVEPWSGQFNKVGLTAAEALQARGFLAREYYLETPDGYLLSLVQAKNPLFKHNKHPIGSKLDPVLFVHGAYTSATFWLLDSAGVKPKDLSFLLGDPQRCSYSVEQLLEIIQNDPSARSMPFLLLNMGYEVWLLNRRGTQQSERHNKGHLERSVEEALKSIPDGFYEAHSRNSNTKSDPVSTIKSWLSSNSSLDLLTKLTSFGKPLLVEMMKKDPERFVHSFDSKYWSFSCDQQVDHDLPMAVDFVLKQTSSKKLIYVGHSLGGALALMALSEHKSLNDKISSVILWAPALNVGATPDNFKLLELLFSVIQQNYFGPVPPTFINSIISELNFKLCSTKALLRSTYCQTLLEVITGKLDRLTFTKPIVWLNVPQATGSVEFYHLTQQQGTNETRRFDFESPELNRRFYGQPNPPEYDLSRIRLAGRIHLYVGNTDALITPAAVKITSMQLTVPHQMHVIDGTGVHFNHAAYVLHDHVARLVNIPSLKSAWNC